MLEVIEKFRKKYTLALLMWAAGTVIAFMAKATLGDYTFFCGTLLAIFGTADLVDKNKFRRNGNGQD